MKHLFLFYFMCCAFIGQAQIKFEKSLQEAFAKAQTKNKLVFIDYYNSECTICQQVNPLLDTHEIGNFYNQHFVSYKINTHNLTLHDEEFINQAGLHIEGVPKFIFFDKNQNFIHYSGVRASIDYIIQIGQDALNPNKRWAEFPQKYQNGNRALLFLYDYSFYAQLFNDTELIHKLANQMYEVFPKENLGNLSSYRLLKNAVFSTENGFFRFWINNQDKLKGFETGQRAGTEKEQLIRIIRAELNQPNKIWTSQNLTLIREDMTLTQYAQNIDMLLWEKELEVYVTENQIIQVNRLFQNVINQNTKEIPTLNYIITHYFDTVTAVENIDYAKLKIEKLLSTHKDNKELSKMFKSFL